MEQVNAQGAGREHSRSSEAHVFIRVDCLGFRAKASLVNSNPKD